MFIIPGFLVSLVTFPGVIVHELAHQLFCRILRVPVYDVKYFQLKNPSGYVVHEPSEQPGKTFLISVGPFIINTIIGIIIMLPVAMELFLLENHNIYYLILGWLGLSILMHSFPSTGDAKVLSKNVLKNKEVPLIIRILVAPVIGLIYIGAYGSIFWLDLVYAVGVSILIPIILAQIL